MQSSEKKKHFCMAIASVVTILRSDKKQFEIATSSDVPVSVISVLEKGVKDPQITTIFKLAEAFGMKSSEFMQLVEKELPEGFSLIEK